MTLPLKPIAARHWNSFFSYRPLLVTPSKTKTKTITNSYPAFVQIHWGGTVTQSSKSHLCSHPSVTLNENVFHKAFTKKHFPRQNKSVLIRGTYSSTRAWGLAPAAGLSNFSTRNDVKRNTTHNDEDQDECDEDQDECDEVENDIIDENASNLPQEQQNERIKVLHEQLEALGISSTHLSDAVTQSLTTTKGFHPNYGKAAIKTYRTYLRPKKNTNHHQKEDVLVAATRCARQIDFLAKRHRSRDADWVRHTDPKDGTRQMFPLILVLDNVRSAFNVGSIFRTADACGCSLLITTGITPHPHGSGSEKLSKSSLGAERVVPTMHFDTTLDAISHLQQQYPKFSLVAMETTERSVDYTSVMYPGSLPTALLPDETSPANQQDEEGTVLFLGNEVSGVDTEIIPLLDMVVEIPMFGAKNSLNVAASAPVVMYEILRQWKNN